MVSKLWVRTTGQIQELASWTLAGDQFWFTPVVCVCVLRCDLERPLIGPVLYNL